MTPSDTAPSPLCVTGMGIHLPVGSGRAAVLQALLAGRNAFAPVRSFDGRALASDLVSEFDPASSVPGINPMEAARIDRATAFALVALAEAMEQAMLRAADYPPHRIGIVVGTSHAGIQHLERIHLALRAGQPVARRWIAACATDHTASIVAARVGATGPRATVSSACASSNCAVGVAMDWLLHGEADCVIAIGTDTVSPSVLGGFNALRAVSASPCAPFSTPSGITLGEGAGVVIVERESAARARGARPLAWVRGYGLSGDAWHETAADAEGRGIEAAMRAALADAGLPASRIDYVSAHGTGTDANDIAESAATQRVVAQGTPVSSPKSFLGHTLGASGIVELVVTCLYLERGLVPPTANFNTTREGCAPLDYVPGEPRDHAVTNFLCNNYGFGGNNASLVISREPGPCAPTRGDDAVAVVGMGAIGAFGGDAQALLRRLWDADCPLPTAGDGPLPFLSAKPVLAGQSLPGNPRASTLIRCALAAVGEALERAGGFDLVGSAPLRCGLVGGITHGALRHIEKLLSSVLDEGIQFASATHFPLTTLNAAAGQVSIAYGIRGCNTTFCGAGAALHYATRLVQDGRQDRAVAFGADELSPTALSLIERAGLAGPGEPAPGEAAGAVVLERLGAARARGATVMGLVAGVACAQGDAAARLALAQAGLAPQEVAAIVLASPATRPAGFAALFGDDFPPTASAATVAGSSPSALLPLNLLAGLEILRRGTVPPPAPGQPAVPIGARQAVLVLHPSPSGECHALVLTRAHGATP